jgi:hypothetical protein
MQSKKNHGFDKDLTSVAKKVGSMQNEVNLLNKDVAQANSIMINGAIEKAFEKHN